MAFILVTRGIILVTWGILAKPPPNLFHNHFYCKIFFTITFKVRFCKTNIKTCGQNFAPAIKCCWQNYKSTCPNSREQTTRATTGKQISMFHPVLGPKIEILMAMQQQKKGCI